MFLQQIPSASDIENAHQRIKPFVHRTPIMSSQNINKIANTEIFFKCENFQKVGAFKFRGATNAVLLLSEAQKEKGVITHSSGNHAQALALAAQQNGIKAHIVMPENAPKVKVNAVLGYGGNIIFCKPTLEARETTVAQIIDKTQATFIHPYDNYDIICGQATAAKELLGDVENLDIIVAPVGGGGLLSGTVLSANYFSENTKVIAAEPEGANDAFLSFQQKKIVPSIAPNTIADGLLTSLSERTFRIISGNVAQILLANDDEIRSAMQLIWERMKIVIEPSSAVPLAVILKNKALFKNQKIGVIISGGNVDFGKF